MGPHGTDMAHQRGVSTLHLGVVQVNGRRTSMRLEPEIWSAIGDIACREGFTRSELLDEIECRRPGTPLTSAVRVFVAIYYRELASGRSHVYTQTGKVLKRSEGPRETSSNGWRTA
jgi:predicted DNA-binding ribbon-helix-helix protein